MIRSEIVLVSVWLVFICSSKCAGIMIKECVYWLSEVYQYISQWVKVCGATLQF